MVPLKKQVAAALDIGSNTIKMLVVEKTDQGLRRLGDRTSETRISQGISQDNPYLNQESINKAIWAIRQLFDEIQTYNPDFVQIAATSAVRDAHNGPDFQKRVQESTGQPVNVLTGEKEAKLIARGVLTDPELVNQKELMIFDMGGGSVECIHVLNRKTQLAQSLPLGGVRLMEKYITDPSKPLYSAEKEHVVQAVLQSAQSLPLQVQDPANTLAVGAGGTYVAIRFILAHRLGKNLSESSPYLHMQDLRSVFDEASNLSLESRLKIPKLPPNRADVFPVSLLALITLGEWAGITRFYHSYHSLRWGMVDELLNRKAQRTV